MNFFEPYFVPRGKTAESLFKWKKFNVEIRNSKGDVLFSGKSIEAPCDWSDLAVEIAASKYFRKSLKEKTIRQLVQRVCRGLDEAAKKQKYFRSANERKAFIEEVKYLLLSQKACFNSPVWFNCGVYERPQVSACFIQDVQDSMGSIFDLLRSEAFVFKFGSGSGTNFSRLRGRDEPLADGGSSSGLLSFLEIFDKAAGSIKSGGTTRRAAKMVCLDIDHPEILEFIDWKAREEKKAQTLIRQGYEADFEGEAYRTVSGQNSNNSVRVTDAFMKAVKEDLEWPLRRRTDGKISKKIPAREIWQKIIQAAWVCADPGVQFHDTIQKWHTCPGSGVIRASNPCSEYMFLDDSACNLASLNVLKFYSSESGYDWSGFERAARTMFLAQEILIDYADYPTEKIRENSHRFRPLGLGYAGLGALLMQMAIPYDSNLARTWASALTALLHGAAFHESALIAQDRGAFMGFRENKKSMLAVLKKHQSALKHIRWQEISDKSIGNHVRNLWADLLRMGQKTGLRNSQATVMAPTGTIGLVMDSETTGIEPEFSLVKWKRMVGGGLVKMVSSSVKPALIKLQYSSNDIAGILRYLSENSSLEGCPLLLKEHLSIFDCAQPREAGHRYLSAQAHLQMMAAVQPFLSGAISKTVNLPEAATEEQISSVYEQAWKLGLKSIAIYRDGSKKSQPLVKNPLCPECGSQTEVSSGCFRCTNCGFTTGCVA